MSYFYQDYKVDETEKSFRISLIEEESLAVLIPKELIRELELNVDEEMIAVLLGVIEIIRRNTSGVGKGYGLKRMVKKTEFAENLKALLQIKTPESLINQISEMKYYEIEEYFILGREEN